MRDLLISNSAFVIIVYGLASYFSCLIGSPVSHIYNILLICSPIL